MIIFLISTSYLTIYQLAHYCTELKSGGNYKMTPFTIFVIVIIFQL